MVVHAVWRQLDLSPCHAIGPIDQIQQLPEGQPEGFLEQLSLDLFPEEKRSDHRRQGRVVAPEYPDGGHSFLAVEGTGGHRTQKVLHALDGVVEGVQSVGKSSRKVAPGEAHGSTPRRP
jgi:hypothetical protein